MWFKNLAVFRMTANWPLTAEQLEPALEAYAQQPIGATQTISTGWDHVADDQFAFVLNRQILLRFKTEKKVVPSSALKQAVAAEVERVEQTTGRKPGKKERRAITEDTLLALLPNALATASATLVWIDPGNGWIVVNTGSQAQSDTIITALVRSLDKLQLQSLLVARSPAVVMTAWLANDDSPDNFAIDRDCVLKANDDTKAVVKYTNNRLDVETLGKHLREGKVCKELALTWNDRLSFVLTDTFRIKKLRALDLVMESRQDTVDEREALDADFTIFTSEVNSMLNDLVQVFGGETPREAPVDEDLF